MDASSSVEAVKKTSTIVSPVPSSARDSPPSSSGSPVPKGMWKPSVRPFEGRGPVVTRDTVDGAAPPHSSGPPEWDAPPKADDAGSSTRAIEWDTEAVSGAAATPLSE